MQIYIPPARTKESYRRPVTDEDRPPLTPSLPPAGKIMAGGRCREDAGKLTIAPFYGNGAKHRPDWRKVPPDPECAPAFPGRFTQSKGQLSIELFAGVTINQIK